MSFTEYNVPIKYTRQLTSVQEYDTGIKDWAGIRDAYEGISIRDKVVCRLDACLSWDRFFKRETIIKYRKALMLIAKGLVTDPKQLSEAILQLVKIDETFSKAINNIFHGCPEDVPFGYHIMQTLANVLISTEEDYRSFFRGKSEVVICISDGYLYFSFEDSEAGPLLIEKDVECEVLSYAKNWKGAIQYYGDI